LSLLSLVAVLPIFSLDPKDGTLWINAAVVHGIPTSAAPYHRYVFSAALSFSVYRKMVLACISVHYVDHVLEEQEHLIILRHL
jgi:hypothetical protein